MNEHDESYELDKKRRLKDWLPVIALLILVFIILGLGTLIYFNYKRIKAEKLAAIKTERPAVNVVTLEVVERTIRELSLK
jgi:CHASE1-domain containing sensor protein